MKKSSITSSILKRALSTYIFDKKDQKQHKIFFGLLPLQELFAKLLKEIASPRSGGLGPERQIWIWWVAEEIWVP